MKTKVSFEPRAFIRVKDVPKGSWCYYQGTLCIRVFQPYTEDVLLVNVSTGEHTYVNHETKVALVESVIISTVK